MRTFVYWFAAEPSAAAAIRSTATTEERQRAEWPHLPVPGVDGPDMNKLEERVRTKRLKGDTRLGGILLDRSKLTATPFTAVSQVAPEFVQHLLAADDATRAAWARAWTGAITGVTTAAALQLIQDLTAFARQAVADGKPVLQLDVM